MLYKDLLFKIPEETKDYRECSEFVVENMEGIIKEAMSLGKNKIIINTNLKLGLPMENINKVAGPFIEAWATETFTNVLEDKNNKYNLINVEAQGRLNKCDIILQFKLNRKNETGITAEVDVKATAEDIKNSGKAPNITSYGRIRTAYIFDPNYLFIILSIKHKVYSVKNSNTNLMDGIMEVVDFNAYDLKFLSSSDISYNPALGNGQIQIKDIHYVTIQHRTTWEFCQLLDTKYLASSKNSLDTWIILAKKYAWIKSEQN